MYIQIHAVCCRSGDWHPYFAAAGMVFALCLELKAKISMGFPMFRFSMAAFTLMAAAPVSAQDSFKLPPEVTPALRAACEGDVRRLCVGPSPTVSKVKRCVMVKFFQLGKRCQSEIKSAGLM